MGSANSLHEKDLEFLLSNTDYSKDTIMTWYQEFGQECPTGKLTLPGFINLYHQFFPAGNATELCEHLFRVFDTDGSGFIDFREFLLAIFLTSSGSTRDKIRAAFRYF